MTKKLFVVLTFIFSFSFVWANVTETLDSLTENKNTLIASLSEKKDNLLDQKQNLEKRLENYFKRPVELINYRYMNPIIKYKASKDIIYV